MLRFRKSGFQARLSGWHRNAWLLLLAFLALPACASRRPDTEQQLLLGVQVNGHDTGTVTEFLMRRGKLMAKPADLRGIRIVVPENIPLQPDGLVALDDLPGLHWKLDQAKQILYLTAPADLLLPTVVQVNPWNIRRTIESGIGSTLNYDAVGNFTGGQAGGTSSLDYRAFSPAGIVNSDWLTYEGASVNTISGSRYAWIPPIPWPT